MLEFPEVLMKLQRNQDISELGVRQHTVLSYFKT
jgi:hypothetical protein